MGELLNKNLSYKKVIIFEIFFFEKKIDITYSRYRRD